MSSDLTVVGGFYREICRCPASDEFWGSGGRAAAAVADLSLQVRFITAADKNAEALIAIIAQTFGFEYSVTPIPQTVWFRYYHGLSVPIIWPRLDAIERVQLSAEGECVLRFGMLDAEVEVGGKTVVYDPQEPISPKHFLSAVRPSRLAYVLNSTEARRLGGSDDIETAAHSLVVAQSQPLAVIDTL